MRTIQESDLSPEQRTLFNSLMEDIKLGKDTKEKMSALAKQLDSNSDDPEFFLQSIQEGLTPLIIKIHP